MNDLRKTLVNDLNDVETALCALEGVKPGTIRQNGYTGDFKGVMAYPVLLVQKGREKGMTDYTKLVKELRGCKYIDYCKDCPRMAANGYVEICNIKDDAAAAIEGLIESVHIRDKHLDELNQYIWKLEAEVKQLEPKRGEWITIRLNNGGSYTGCSCCEAPIPTDTMLDYIPESESKYCYSCGAKMEVRDD